MRILGALLAGGRSSRFGSDKALARMEGKPLIEHAIAALGNHADRVVVCGRIWPESQSLADRPLGGLGPLAGLNAALHFARDAGFGAVLCAPLDVFPLEDALPLLAGERRAVLCSQWSVGLWPAALAPRLDHHLATGARSIRSWMAVADPVLVDDRHLQLRNLNTPDDLPVGAFGCGRAGASPPAASTYQPKVMPTRPPVDPLTVEPAKPPLTQTWSSTLATAAPEKPCSPR